jgi:glycosyltransferase involved in cell wall biosynthesis
MRCLPELLKKRPEARVLIIGGDGVSYGQKPTEGKSWAEIFAREVRPLMSDSEWGRVHFLGKIPYEQYLKVLQISSAHVYLTYPFVLSWSLLEAMSVGCPIVASDTGPIQEVISHGETGLLFNFFDKNQLLSSIVHILEDRKFAIGLGAKARETVVQNYDLFTITVPSQLRWIEGIMNH